VVYEIPGFGGDHHLAFAVAAASCPDVGVEMIRVVLDPSCRLGHHVFADSANNGPCGRALIDELYPLYRTRYRAVRAPAARFLTGHSSGGWSSLWLQVAHADSSAGVWSTAPDPVDFRDFQRVNIYAPLTNLFWDETASSARSLAREQGAPLLQIVQRHGGGLRPRRPALFLRAVFSPRGADGRPLRLWNHATGAIDSKVAQAWQRYDIRMILEKNWPALGPQARRQAARLHGRRGYVLPGRRPRFYCRKR